jgi:hypothetical protein
MMLREARHAGAETAVLLSSHTGAMLYPVLGYRQIGTLLGLVPKRQERNATRDWRPTPRGVEHPSR